LLEEFDKRIRLGNRRNRPLQCQIDVVHEADPLC